MEDEKKYNPNNVKKIEKLLEEGNTITDTCAVVGISHSTFLTWKKEYPEFASKVEKANAFAKQIHLQNIRNAGERDWRASAWFLERTSPKDFGQKQLEPPAGKIDGKQINIQIVTGNGYIPPVRSVNVTSEGSLIPDPAEIQSPGVAQESQKDNDSDIRTDKAESA